MHVLGNNFPFQQPAIPWNRSRRYGPASFLMRRTSPSPQPAPLTDPAALQIEARGVRVQATEGVVRAVLSTAVRLAPFALAYLVVDRICTTIENVSDE